MRGLTRVAELAKSCRMTRQGMLKRLKDIQAKDVARGRRVDWLTRWGRTWWVNVSRLGRAHPEFVGVLDAREIDHRLAKLEAGHVELTESHQTTIQRQNSIAARVRTISSWKRLETVGNREAASQ